jgi:DNA-directed RNA polymerase specialized sigma24 family protein
MTTTAEHQAIGEAGLLLGPFLEDDRWGATRVCWSDGDPAGAGSPEAERALTLAAAEGDDDALDDLCRQEWPAVHRALVQAVPDPAEAEELAQEIFARAIAALPRLATPGNSFAVEVATLTAAVVAGLAHRATVTPPPETGSLVLSRSERPALEAALNRLGGPEREVLRLRLLEGRTPSEIGAELGRPTETVRQVQHRGAVALRQALAAVGGGG